MEFRFWAEVGRWKKEEGRRKREEAVQAVQAVLVALVALLVLLALLVLPVPVALGVLRTPELLLWKIMFGVDAGIMFFCGARISMTTRERASPLCTQHAARHQIRRSEKLVDCGLRRMEEPGQ